MKLKQNRWQVWWAFLSRNALLIWTAFFLVSAPLLYAHEGEEQNTPAAPISIGGNRLSAAGQSDAFELVVKYGQIKPGEKATLDAYLSDFETNAPIAGALIGVTVNGNDSISGAVEAEKDPGLYNVGMAFPQAGKYDLLFDINTNDKSDFVIIKGIEIGVEVIAQAKPGSTTPLWLIVILPLVVLGVIILFILRKHNKFPATIVTFIIMTLFGGMIYSIASAHGDEDQGTAAAGSGATLGTPGYMAKGSQFLLGVRTIKAEVKSVSKVIPALGRVVALPKNQVQVYAPQSGLLVASRDVAYPNQGDWVNKGQAIAVIQVLDKFKILAPISGIVTAVHSVPGEQVDPSHELFTICDYTKVWVEANLFENDLIHLDSKPSAEINADVFPNESFSARFVNFDNSVDPATRTLKAIYEISNPKMLLRPGMIVNANIETEKRIQALVVPAASVMDWEGTKVVFVHEQPEIFEMRPIKVLGYYGNLVAVEGNVAEGDRVVTTGAYELLNIPIRLAEASSK